ncbi:MAG: RT0821/Lpp0805 family surface protein [Pseudomonadota bacterium]
MVQNNTPLLRPLMALALVAAVSGCAVKGNALADISTSEELVTSSVVAKTKVDGIDDTDAKVITNTVTAASIASEVKPLAWANPETGSSGAIVAIDNFMGKHGQKCRGFKTTVKNFMGIAFYNGEACQISASEWVLSWFKSADS